MWHEARKQERKIRGMMVDYKKRAERRREFYEKTKADPTQFIQLHGRRCKIHLDPAVAQAADSPLNMMPWQGHADNLIDRFDGRAHLDIIPEYKNKSEVDSARTPLQQWEERQTNYERYRILVENDFIGLSEEKFLQQIYLEEQFGPINKSNEEEKKKLSDKKAAIGYVYEDSTNYPAISKDEEEKKESDDEIDLDVTVDVGAISVDQAKEMNDHSLKYGMNGDDFITLMTRDKEEAESLRLAKEAEEEKAMYSGRKSRRERRAFREKKLLGRKISPPSYAARESPTKQNRRSRSTSHSRSRSPVDDGKITFITSFGGEPSDDSANETKSSFAPSMVPTVELPNSTSVKSSAKPIEIGPRRLSGSGSPMPSTSVTKGRSHRSSGSKTSRNSGYTNSSALSSNRSRSSSKSPSESRSRSRSRQRDRDSHRRRYSGSRHRDRHSSRSESRSPSRSSRHYKRRRRPSRSRSRSRSRSSSSTSRSYSSGRSSSSSSSRYSKSRRSRSRSPSRSHSASRSYSRTRSKSKSYSRSQSRSGSSRSRSETSRSSSSSRSPRRSLQSPKCSFTSKAKSHSRSPNGKTSPKRTISSLTGEANTGSGSTTAASTSVRYYGRRKEKSSSSESSVSEGETDKSSQQRTLTTSKGRNVVGKAGFGTKVKGYSSRAA
ncbi:hypothetical protein CHUAL_009481 [Chamberlinius hualienensis]